jgi:hypothetical protein
MLLVVVTEQPLIDPQPEGSPLLGLLADAQTVITHVRLAYYSHEDLICGR